MLCWEAKEVKKEVLCQETNQGSAFKCGQPGHVAANCPNSGPMRAPFSGAAGNSSGGKGPNVGLSSGPGPKGARLSSLRTDFAGITVARARARMGPIASLLMCVSVAGELLRRYPPTFRSYAVHSRSSPSGRMTQAASSYHRRRRCWGAWTTPCMREPIQIHGQRCVPERKPPPRKPRRKRKSRLLNWGGRAMGGIARVWKRSRGLRRSASNSEHTTRIPMSRRPWIGPRLRLQRARRQRELKRRPLSSSMAQNSPCRGVLPGCLEA